MENNAIYDRIEDLMAKADEIKLAVDEFGEMLGDIQAFTNETNVVVKDILNGRQISEWIADLAASGKASATYADASRMQALIADRDACRNVQANQHIFDWGVANNKVGAFFNSALGAVSGVNWGAITTPAQMCKNSAAFTAIVKDSSIFTVTLNNAVSRPAIFNGYAVTEKIIAGSSVALGVLKGRKKTLSFNDDKEQSGLKWFVISLRVKSADGDFSTSTTLTHADGTTTNKSCRGDTVDATVNKFTKAYNHRSWFGMGSNIVYVDFS